MSDIFLLDMVLGFLIFDILLIGFISVVILTVFVIVKLYFWLLEKFLK